MLATDEYRVASSHRLSSLIICHLLTRKANIGSRFPSQSASPCLPGTGTLPPDLNPTTTCTSSPPRLVVYALEVVGEFRNDHIGIPSLSWGVILRVKGVLATAFRGKHQSISHGAHSEGVQDSRKWKSNSAWQ